MCGCSNFDGDGEFDNFSLKNAKKRRTLRKKLMDEGMSRGDARRQAKEQIPREELLVILQNLRSGKRDKEGEERAIKGELPDDKTNREAVVEQAILKDMDFDNKKEGNKFRGWVNDTYPDYAKAIDLDRTGSHRNKYIEKAWKKHGGEYLSIIVPITVDEIAPDNTVIGGEDSVVVDKGTGNGETDDGTDVKLEDGNSKMGLYIGIGAVVLIGGYFLMKRFRA